MGKSKLSGLMLAVLCLMTTEIRKSDRGQSFLGVSPRGAFLYTCHYEHAVRQG